MLGAITALHFDNEPRKSKKIFEISVSHIKLHKIDGTHGRRLIAKQIDGHQKAPGLHAEIAFEVLESKFQKFQKMIGAV